MRGSDAGNGSLFSYVDLEHRVRPDHPLRVIREIANASLKALSEDFAALYSPIGRESIPPERLVRALLLQAFYSIRSERQLVERIEYDLLFRWFVGLGIDEVVWDATTFTKNRDRLLDGDVATKFLSAVLSQSRVKRLLEHTELPYLPTATVLGHRHANRRLVHVQSDVCDIVHQARPPCMRLRAGHPAQPSTFVCRGRARRSLSEHGV